MTQTTLQAIPDALLVPPSRIRLMVDQPRSERDEAKDAELRASIARTRENGGGIAGTGILQPLLGRWESGAFDENGDLRPDAFIDLIAGEGRLLSATVLELDYVPIVVTDQNSEAAYEAALMENLSRSDLSPLDEGRAFQFLMNKHGIGRIKLSRMLYGSTQREGYIQNRLDLLRLPDDVKPVISQRSDSISLARRIATVSDAEARQELVEMAQGGATLNTVEDAIRKAKHLGPKTPRAEKRESTFSRSEQEEFRRGESFTRPSEDAPIREVFGSSRAREVVGTLPKFSVGEALESIERQLQSAKEALEGQQQGGIPLPPATRAALLQRAHRVERALEAVTQVVENGVEKKQVDFKS